ncbi:probable G-protein coupled receptor 156 [Esox lucius]|uniref:G-protein coupled receptors family 3 profile domain-containing protein n=1 Tax=Esox lucius TaxID=8010 RepID=A0AAY5KVR4_ESOLU|nr:probable G-protein coupled receptor 156 [Esox lucius]XP_010898530.2 probable G-protein coupled receptor 156 [Esox lucius]XP_019910100.2 probable G-protein coupled receptor 156 [Esox lucius]XP_019910101.2 probable G-protein coupled receptor 156 [Esox lucius]
MESELNCSSHCDSRLCLIHPGVNTQEGLEILQRLCSLGTMEAELQRRSLSPVLRAVVWTLLSCGILLAFCFLLFTLRFKNNRIVKMSSPNLNVLTLCGSVLAYCSGFLFAVDERIYQQVGGPRAILQARIWTLCIGSTLVFGPILGKTWRLYRVFTQRVPDKRVIIRDIQLMGLVALLILVDLLVLTAWSLTDPVKCARSIGAVVKVMERDVSYSLTQLDSCSSLYSDLWVILLAVIKGNLLLYGTYLAGLTSNVSLPPVNQSPTIMTAVSLITLSTAVAFPVWWFLPAWPNVVYGVVAGAIFVCTLSTNCMLFVPQLTQWRHFEEEHTSPGQMAKYFSSPSKSVHSVYSQDEIYYLLGENTSMKRLLNEKNAVIDSLQEQVNNAKDKLLRLMSNSHPQEDQELDSSTTNLQSSSTQTTELHSDCPPTPLPQRDIAGPALSSPPRCPLPLPAPPAHSGRSTSPSAPPSTPLALCLSSGDGVSVKPWNGEFDSDTQVAEMEKGGCRVEGTRSPQKGSNVLVSPQPSASSGIGVRTPGEKAGTPATPHCQSNCVSPFAHPCPVDLVSADSGTSGCHSDPPSLSASVARQPGFVSSAELQEILQELSVDAVMETALRSPNHNGRTKRPSQASLAEPLVVSPLSLRSPRSPNPPFLFRYPSISPYVMRKRRPPFHVPRGGPLPCFLPGSEPPCWGKRRDTGPPQPHKNTSKTQTQVSPEPTETSPLRLDHSCTAADESGHKKQVTNRCRRRGTRRESRPPPPPKKRSSSGRASSPRGAEDGEGAPGRDCGQDSNAYWESDSSSSADLCYYHHPYCDTCLQHASHPSSDTSSSDSSDSEYGGFVGLCRSTHHPEVNFKEDLKPTFV